MALHTTEGVKLSQMKDSALGGGVVKPNIPLEEKERVSDREARGRLQILEVVERDHPVLHQLWFAIGLNDEERENLQVALVEDVKQLFQKRLQQAKKMKEEMEKEVKDLKARLEKLKAVLSDVDTSVHPYDPTGSIPLQLQQLRALIDYLQQIKSERENVLQGLQTKLHALCDELGWRAQKETENEKNEKEKDKDKQNANPHQADGKDVQKFVSDEFFKPVGEDCSQTMITKFKEKVEEGSVALEELKKTIPGLKEEIIGLWKSLFISPEQCTEPFDDFILNRKNGKNAVAKMKTFQIVKTLEGKKNQLLEEKQNRINSLNKTMEHINALWNLLEIGEDDMDRQKFLQAKDKLPQYSPAQIALCKKEQRRLEELSESKLKVIIDDLHIKLKDLWEQLHMGDAQINQFLHALRNAGGKYSYDVLEMLREEVRLLTERLARMGPLIKLIVRREWIKKEMKVFERKASDPQRLFGKSSQLLEEEKFRRIVATEFPRLTEKLQRGLVKYEKKYQGEVFMFEGKRYLKTMKEEKANPNFALLHLRLLPGNSGDDDPNAPTPANPEEFEELVTVGVRKRTSTPTTPPTPTSNGGDDDVASSSSTPLNGQSSSPPSSTSTSPTSTTGTGDRDRDRDKVTSPRTSYKPSMGGAGGSSGTHPTKKTGKATTPLLGGSGPHPTRKTGKATTPLSGGSGTHPTRKTPTTPSTSTSTPTSTSTAASRQARSSLSTHSATKPSVKSASFNRSLNSQSRTANANANGTDSAEKPIRKSLSPTATSTSTPTPTQNGTTHPTTGGDQQQQQKDKPKNPRLASLANGSKASRPRSLPPVAITTTSTSSSSGTTKTKTATKKTSGSSTPLSGSGKTVPTAASTAGATTTTRTSGTSTTPASTKTTKTSTRTPVTTAKAK